jgi:mannose-1-phosphate guanylyltransferase/mannose-1-phosphate guanylyltransferase/mannose-6-phosphate isomerase
MRAVILSGGSGTRLWPVSRRSYPKQFCDFFDQSFLENTLDRLSSFGAPEVITIRSMATLTERALKKKGLAPTSVVYEPLQKNTGPAIALSCHLALMNGAAPTEVVGVFPADHLISEEREFSRVLHLAVEEAGRGSVVTLGIRPHAPETGYGYIETKDGPGEVRSVLKFHEKPTLEKARSYLKSGQFFWNAGIFIFRLDRMVEAFQKHQPQLWEAVSGIKKDLSNLEYQYAKLPSISIDYAIMEKLSDLKCIPSDFGWSDVGSWDEISRVSEELQEVQSSGKQQVFQVESAGNFVYSLQQKVIGLVGVDNLLVVDTADGLLVSRKGMSQKVKELVEQIKESGSNTASEHAFEWRPWGGFEVLADTEQFKVKKITVDPGARLSYQSHKKRAEHWTVIEGEAEVILDDVSHFLGANGSIEIPMGSKHRLKNVGKTPLTVVEIQTGTYFGEDDIFRYQDDYARQAEEK